MLNRLLEYWGLNPPQRRNRRIPVALAARVLDASAGGLGLAIRRGDAAWA